MVESFSRITAKQIEYNLCHLPQLVFEVTDSCNLRCKYCGYADLYGGYEKREDLKFPFYKAKMIIDYLHSIWKKNCCAGVIVPTVIEFYGGEPLLNMPFIRQVIEYIESLEQVGRKFYYSMTSNAMLLNKYMDFIVKKEFSLLISLDGDKEGQGYRVDAAGNNSFDRVMANINLLRSAYPEYFKRHVMFNSVLHNKNDVETIFNFIKTTFGKEPSISPLNTSGIRKDKVEEFNNTYKSFDESIEQAGNCEVLKNEMFIKNPQTNALLNYIYYQSGNVFWNHNDLLMQKSLLPIPPTGTCPPFSKKMFVTVKGRILQCERINHEFVLGQITDTEVELDLEHIAEQHNGYVFKYARQCVHCANKNACAQCVYQIDDINEKNTKCESFCSAELNKRKGERSLRYLVEHPELYSKILTNVVIRG